MGALLQGLGGHRRIRALRGIRWVLPVALNTTQLALPDPPPGRGLVGRSDVLDGHLATAGRIQVGTGQEGELNMLFLIIIPLPHPLTLPVTPTFSRGVLIFQSFVWLKLADPIQNEEMLFI